jgi:hypothetical protein
MNEIYTLFQFYTWTLDDILDVIKCASQDDKGATGIQGVFKYSRIARNSLSTGHIESKCEEIRKVLEREGIIKSP